jgi:hypothetical protein
VACSGFYSGAPYRKWRGHRLLSVDGNRLHLPNHPSIKEEFGEHLVGRKADTPVSMALISLLYDPLNLLTLDSQIGAWNQSEQSLLLKHTDNLQRGDLLLADRGYPSIYLFYLLRSKGVEFCFRMKEYARYSFVRNKKKRQEEGDIPHFVICKAHIVISLSLFSFL